MHGSHYCSSRMTCYLIESTNRLIILNFCRGIYLSRATLYTHDGEVAHSYMHYKHHIWSTETMLAGFKEIYLQCSMKLAYKNYRRQETGSNPTEQPVQERSCRAADSQPAAPIVCVCGSSNKQNNYDNSYFSFAAAWSYHKRNNTMLMNTMAFVVICYVRACVHHKQKLYVCIYNIIYILFSLCVRA